MPATSWPPWLTMTPANFPAEKMPTPLLTVGSDWLTWRITFPPGPTTSNGAWIRVPLPGPLSSRASSSLTRCSRSS